MTSEKSGAGSGSVFPKPITVLSDPTTILKEYVVKRDNERPLSFAGVRLAYTQQPASASALPSFEALEAAVYRTRGGKYITTLSKVALYESALSVLGAQAPSGYNKAEVHDTFEAAVGWFRPGRITDEIRHQLKLDEPIRVD